MADNKIAFFIKRVESTAEEDFFTQRTFYHLSSSMFHEMCELLKEQEAVPVIQREVLNMMFVWCCGSCGVAITDGDKFCRMCGKEMKWNGIQGANNK